MKPKSLSEVKSQDEFLEYLIDNYYHILGEGNGITGTDILDPHCMLTVSPSLIVLSESLTGNISWFADYMKVSNTRVASVQDYKDKIKTLRNKPSFEDHPDAECFVQNDRGSWYKNTNTSEVKPSFLGVWHSKTPHNGWVFIQAGRVIGNWQRTFEKAPEKKETTVCKKDVIIEQLVAKGIHNYLDSLVKDAFATNRGRQQQKYIKELEQENQELKTKIDRTKQILY